MSDDAFAMLIGLVVGALIFGAIGSTLLDDSDRNGVGFALGFFLGPIGLIIAAIMRNDRPRHVVDGQASTDSRTAPDEEVSGLRGNHTRRSAEVPILRDGRLGVGDNADVQSTVALV